MLSTLLEDSIHTATEWQGRESQEKSKANAADVRLPRRECYWHFRGIVFLVWVCPDHCRTFSTPDPTQYLFFFLVILNFFCFPSGCNDKESICQCRRQKKCGFDPWVRKILWRRKWQPIPVFLLGKFHVQRHLEGYSPQGHKESDTTERAHAHTHKYILTSWFTMCVSFRCTESDSCMCIYIYTHTHTNTYICVYIHISCVYTYICVYIYESMHIYILFQILL